MVPSLILPDTLALQNLAFQVALYVAINKTIDCESF